MAAQKYPMETYHGIVRTPADAIKLFEACRLGMLPRVQRRLSEKERQAIRSGSVFVWDEREAGMRRWTDGKSWSASRVSGSFLTYREMEGKRGGGGFNTMRRVAGKTPDSSGRGSDDDQDDGEPDGYRYKVDGLMKQSFSITTSNGQHLHLISYYARPPPGKPELPQPTTDPSLRSVNPIKGMYPESSMTDNTPIPAVTRMPMSHPHHPHYPAYGHHLNNQYPPPPPMPNTNAGSPHHQPHPTYSQNQAGYSWPPSPIATPPYNHHYTTASSSSYTQQPTPLHGYPQDPHQPYQAPYSRTPPPPPGPGYYGIQPPPPHYPPPHSYNGSSYPLPPPPPQGQYNRAPLPPANQQADHGMSYSRTSPPAQSPYHQGSASGNNTSGHNHHLSSSPRSLYHHPQAQSTGPPPSSSGASSSYTAASPYGPQGSQSNGAPGPLPSLTTSSSSTNELQTLTPPRPLSASPTHSSYYQQSHQPKSYQLTSEAYSNGGSPSTAGNNYKSSLSALLHPTPTNSEPNSAHAGGSNSGGNSPRQQDSGGNASTAGGGGGNSGSAPALVPQHFLQPAPSGEDTRALSRLDKKFCI